MSINSKQRPVKICRHSEPTAQRSKSARQRPVDQFFRAKATPPPKTPNAPKCKKSIAKPIFGTGGLGVSNIYAIQIKYAPTKYATIILIRSLNLSFIFSLFLSSRVLKRIDVRFRRSIISEKTSAKSRPDR